MKDFLRKLYCGEIKPSENVLALTDETQNLEKLMARNEEELLASINDKSKSCFKKYVDCSTELNWIYYEEAFIEGISFATKLFIDALG
jgi:hypothetical protein